MRRRLLKSKIHRATVTGADIHYEGSVSVDRRLMEMADIVPWEQVAVLDVDNGNRFETYAIEGGPGEVRINGAAARLVDPGHLVIVLSYADYEDHELEAVAPCIVFVDERNLPLQSRVAGHSPL